jgi:anti-anti-sigma regulatory factor
VVRLLPIQAVMLRIRTIPNGLLATTLHLEGRIVSTWVSVLEDECTRLLQEPGRRLRLDLGAVLFVDDRGVLVLQWLTAQGIELTNIPPFIETRLRGDRTS